MKLQTQFVWDGPAFPCLTPNRASHQASAPCSSWDTRMEVAVMFVECSYYSACSCMLTYTIRNRVTVWWVWNHCKRRHGKKLCVMLAVWAEEKGSWSMLYSHTSAVDAIFDLGSSMCRDSDSFLVIPLTHNDIYVMYQALNNAWLNGSQVCFVICFSFHI